MTRAEGLDDLVLVALHRAGEPVREAVLYERVREASPLPLDPDVFLASLDRLVTARRAQMSIEHELPERDPEPFAPRYYTARE